MYNEYVSQDAGSDTPEDLPTYGYLEEQERSNPNSRCIPLILAMYVFF